MIRALDCYDEASLADQIKHLVEQRRETRLSWNKKVNGIAMASYCKKIQRWWRERRQLLDKWESDVNRCYGVSGVLKRYHMSDTWGYLVEFDKHGDQQKVAVEDYKHGSTEWCEWGEMLWYSECGNYFCLGVEPPSERWGCVYN